MATAARPAAYPDLIDRLAGTPRAHAIDRWIYVFTAASFVAIVLAGFLPDSVDKIAAVSAGTRPPFPIALHLHAVLMGSFLLLLLTQTWLVATGRIGWHMQLGMASGAIVAALVVVGFILVPTIYQETVEAIRVAPPEAQAVLQAVLARKENIMLNQIRMGILFPLFIAVGLRARRTDSGLHKRMMILATAVVLAPGIVRIPWLPTTFPASPTATDLYMLAAIAPMFGWDVYRNGYVHRAYWIWLAGSLPFALVTYALWNTAWWHAVARGILAG